MSKWLVLSGGGSKGSWQIGAVYQLLLEGNKYDGIVGTSVGSLNGAALSTVGVDAAIDVWTSIKHRRDVMRVALPKVGDYDGFFHFNPLKKTLLSLLNNEEYKIPVWVVTTNLSDGKVNYIKLGQSLEKDVDAILASCSISGINKPINGMVDGGHREIAPLNFALSMGAKEIDVIITDTPNAVTKWKKPKFLPIVSVIGRAIEIMTNEIVSNDIIARCNRDGVRLFYPKTPLDVDSGTYDPKSIAQYIVRGRTFK
jgi:NTE family protein